MSKEREMYGIRILSNDEYNEYKGTYEEQIEDLKEEVKYQDLWRREYRDRIDKAIKYIEEDMYSEPNELYGLVDGEHLLDILKGDNNE